MEEISDSTVLEARMVWRKMGKTLKRAVRCTGGARKGRVVSKASQCSAPIDIKKRMVMKRTKSKFGKRLIGKSRMTKKRNPLSRRLRTLNR